MVDAAAAVADCQGRFEIVAVASGHEPHRTGARCKCFGRVNIVEMAD